MFLDTVPIIRSVLMCVVFFLADCNDYVLLLGLHKDCV